MNRAAEKKIAKLKLNARQIQRNKYIYFWRGKKLLCFNLYWTRSVVNWCNDDDDINTDYDDNLLTGNKEKEFFFTLVCVCLARFRF